MKKNCSPATSHSKRMHLEASLGHFEHNEAPGKQYNGGFSSSLDTAVMSTIEWVVHTVMMACAWGNAPSVSTQKWWLVLILQMIIWGHHVLACAIKCVNTKRIILCPVWVSIFTIVRHASLAISNYHLRLSYEEELTILANAYKSVSRITKGLKRLLIHFSVM